MRYLPDDSKKLTRLEKALAVLHKLFFRCTLMFTILLLIISFIGVIARNVDNRGIDSGVIIAFFLLCFLIAIVYSVSDFMKAKNVNAVLIYVVHFLLSYGAFYLVFINGNLFEAYLISSNATNNNPVFTAIALTFLFIGVYMVVAAVKFGWFVLMRKLENRKKGYKEIYTDITDENNW